MTDHRETYDRIAKAIHRDDITRRCTTEQQTAEVVEAYAKAMAQPGDDPRPHAAAIRDSFRSRFGKTPENYAKSKESPLRKFKRARAQKRELPYITYPRERLTAPSPARTTDRERDR